ncbi:MAG: hypothetical protein ACI9X4_000674 [Glaciecola sp.]|jgi:hypothetical protein
MCGLPVWRPPLDPPVTAANLAASQPHRKGDLSSYYK